MAGAEVAAQVDAQSLGPVIRGMRRGLGLTLGQMSERVGVSVSTLSRFETGERRPSPELRERITSVIADEVLRQGRGDAA